ncbi:MAG TPA: HAD-IA family hydrolase [Acidimicrobiales bacterium]|nr:HAD-IA family hydrolase [Acidimicrobiales bacterium]
MHDRPDARQQRGVGPIGLSAVVFDVDGTLVDSEREGHRVAFNQAFADFDLPYQWDDELYGRLLRVTGGQRRIDGYLAEQGMPEDERARLAPALHRHKTDILRTMVVDGMIQPRPGVVRLLVELFDRRVRLAVATTGSRGWVEQLLERVLAQVEFEAVVTGDEVDARKPDPEAFLAALEHLGTTTADTVAVEDSHEGLVSATAAGLACVVVTNGYTADHDLSTADLVLDGFGAPGDPARVVADPHGTGCAGILDVDILERLTARNPTARNPTA